MANVSRRCISCACHDKDKCQKDFEASADCTGFLSWADYYAREKEHVERSLKHTYMQGIVLALCVAAISLISYVAK